MKKILILIIPLICFVGCVCPNYVIESAGGNIDINELFNDQINVFCNNNGTIVVDFNSEYELGSQLPYKSKYKFD